MVCGDRYCAECAAERQRPRIAHEYGSGRRIKPEEGEASAHDSGTEYRQLTRTGNMRDAEIARKIHAAYEIGDKGECACRDNDRHRRQPVQPVSQIDRIARPYDHDGREDIVERAHFQAEIIEERDV